MYVCHATPLADMHQLARDFGGAPDVCTLLFQEGGGLKPALAYMLGQSFTPFFRMQVCQLAAINAIARTHSALLSKRSLREGWLVLSSSPLPARAVLCDSLSSPACCAWAMHRPAQPSPAQLMIKQSAVLRLCCALEPSAPPGVCVGGVCHRALLGL